MSVASTEIVEYVPPSPSFELKTEEVVMMIKTPSMAQDQPMKPQSPTVFRCWVALSHRVPNLRLLKWLRWLISLIGSKPRGTDGVAEAGGKVDGQVRHVTRSKRARM